MHIPLRPVLALVLASVACGDKAAEEDWRADCDETCSKLYAEEGCHLQRAGQPNDELTERCVSDCSSMFGVSGEARDRYQPTEYAPATEADPFTNEAEAELWMDCVDTTSCQLLDQGYCAPGW